MVILGRGAAGKSTLAARLSAITALPLIELDKLFWRPGLAATPRDEWQALQRKLVEQEEWIMDGDLDPYDSVEIRLRAADTIILLDFSLLRCAWQAIGRSREHADFWRWLVCYRRQSRPILLQMIAQEAPNADFRVFRNRRALMQFVAELALTRRNCN